MINSDLPRWPGRLLAVLALFSLPPLTAEVLSGYQGHATPLGVLTGIAIAGPLYGTVAVLIREVAVRTGRGWATILLLSGAAGLVQAGLIDQSLLRWDQFVDSPYWTGLPAVVPLLGVDLSQVLVFVGGHLMVTFAGPIALVQGCAPSIARRPWLGRPGLVIMGLAYLVAAGLFCYELAIAPGLTGTPGQLAAVVIMVGLLVLLAFVVPSGSFRRVGARRAGRVPSPAVVAVITLVLVGGHFLTRQPEPTGGALPWLWIAVSVGLLVVLGVLLVRWSQREGWRDTHVLAVAAAPLLCTALLAFAVPPVEGDWPGKLISNALLLGLLLAALVWAGARSGQRVRTSK